MAKDKSEAPVYKRWWFWVIIAVLILAIGGAAGGANKDATKIGETNDSSESSISGADTKSEETKVFKVGDVIAIEDQEMTITSVDRDWQTGNPYSKAKDGKEYVRLHITLKNNAKDNLSYYSTFWTMEDADGAIENSTITVNNDDALSYGEIASGGKKSGTLVFEMQKGTNGLKVHYKPSFWSGDREAIIEL